jgi:hypothetical protein
LTTKPEVAVSLFARKKDNWLTRFMNREENDPLRIRKPAKETTDVLKEAGVRPWRRR